MGNIGETSEENRLNEPNPNLKRNRQIIWHKDTNPEPVARMGKTISGIVGFVGFAGLVGIGVFLSQPAHIRLRKTMLVSKDTSAFWPAGTTSCQAKWCINGITFDRPYWERKFQLGPQVPSKWRDVGIGLHPQSNEVDRATFRIPWGAHEFGGYALFADDYQGKPTNPCPHDAGQVSVRILVDGKLRAPFELKGQDAMKVLGPSADPVHLGSQDDLLQIEVDPKGQNWCDTFAIAGARFIGPRWQMWLDGIASQLGVWPRRE